MLRIFAFVLMAALAAGGEDLRPRLTARDIVNAADHSWGRVSPGEIVVIFAENAGPEKLLGAQLGRDGRVATELERTRVLFDGVAAPLSFTVRGQVGAIVPYRVSGKTATEIVVEYEGVRSAPVSVPVVESAPAIFTLHLEGKGQAAILNENGCCNSAQNPAARGTPAALYATGAGETMPAGVDGSVPTFARLAEYPVPRLPVRVLVGGEPAKITYAGAAPHAAAGLLQVNFVVPENAPVGDAVPLVLMLGETRSAEGVTMAVRSPVRQVLVVHRNAAVRARLRRMLTSAGYRVRTAGSDAAGVEEARREIVDLAICGRGISGDVVQAMKRERPRMLVAAMTPGLGPESLRRADLMGAQAVLTRTMERAVLVRRVRELLRTRGLTYMIEPDAPVDLKRPIVR